MKQLTIIYFTAILATLFLPKLSNAQYCTTTYAAPCVSGFTNDVIDDFFTTGGITNITNMNSNCSGPSSYSFTGMSCSGCPGETIDMGVQADEAPGAWAQGYAVWIDWDNSLTFDPGEKVMSVPSGLTTQYGSFTIPGAQPAGTYRMRVRANFSTHGDLINPCGPSINSYGETEDYEVIVSTCNPTICNGDSTELDLGTMPPGVISYSWSPAIDISDAFGGPIVEVWPSDTTIYTCTITSVDSVWSVPIEVYVNQPANPYAGMDDTICHDVMVGYPFAGAMVEVPAASLILNWDMTDYLGVGSPSVLFTPADAVLNPSSQVSLPGTYEYVLFTEDIGGVCPDQSDTVYITFSKENHTLAGTNPSCFGAADGTVTCTSTGTLGAVEYSIDGGITWQVSNVFTGLPSGIHSITSRDASGCEFTSTFTLEDPTEIEITTSADTTVCQNGTATVTANASGGASYTYDWSIPGASDAGTQTISPIVSPTIITVTAYSELGCPSAEDTIIVTLRDPITLSITANDSVCPGDPSGANLLLTFGGDGAFTYSWTANGVALGDVATSINTNPTENTTYCVTVADGCETTPVTICTQTIMRPVPVPSLTTDLQAGCNPLDVNFSSGIPATSIATWQMDGVTLTGANVPYTFDGVDFYNVSLTVTNEFGCTATSTWNDYIEVVDVPNAEFFINPNPTTIFNTTVDVNPVLSGSEYTYYWSAPEGIPSTSTEESPRITFPEGIPGIYEVELTVTNEYGCFYTVKHTVTVESDVIIYAPNIFTPDGDFYNETWRVHMDGIDIYDFHLRIYNRWGETVWESFDAEGVWDGTYGGNLVQDGTYIWVINVKESTNDRIRQFTGTVNVLK